MYHTNGIVRLLFPPLFCQSRFLLCDSPAKSELCFRRGDSWYGGSCPQNTARQNLSNLLMFSQICNLKHFLSRKRESLEEPPLGWTVPFSYHPFHLSLTRKAVHSPVWQGLCWVKCLPHWIFLLVECGACSCISLPRLKGSVFIRKCVALQGWHRPVVGNPRGENPVLKDHI